MIVFLTQKGKARYPAFPVLPFFLCLLSTALAAHPIKAQSLSSLPVISRLDSRDTMFRQYMQDVEASRRLLSSSRQTAEERILSSLTIYSYTLQAGENLLNIAARCNLPYATLASLNRLSNIEDLTGGRVLLLPSVPGIFVSETPGTGLEQLLFSTRAAIESGENRYEGVLLSIPREGKTERFRFIPGDDFTPTERIFFLDRSFRFPLQNFQVTSLYGPRINPVTGRPGVHRGIDLAAPEGSGVYAVRSGTVMEIGDDPILGKYIIISHDNNWVSLYGHLSEVNTVLRAELQSTSLIGKVGSTGQSTGPHLHFELRQNGQNQDPARLLGLFRGTAGQ